jgi:hypothetical protein
LNANNKYYWECIPHITGLLGLAQLAAVADAYNKGQPKLHNIARLYYLRISNGLLAFGQLVIIAIAYDKGLLPNEIAERTPHSKGTLQGCKVLC